MSPELVPLPSELLDIMAMWPKMFGSYTLLSHSSLPPSTLTQSLRVRPGRGGMIGSFISAIRSAQPALLSNLPQIQEFASIVPYPTRDQY